MSGSNWLVLLTRPLSRASGSGDIVVRLIGVSMTELAAEVARGVLRQIDLINRRITVSEDHDTVVYSMAPQSEILLNGERVKLRMLQPRDNLRIAYYTEAEGRIALSVEAVTRGPRIGFASKLKSF